MVPAALDCIVQSVTFEGIASFKVKDLRSPVLGLVPCGGHATLPSHTPMVWVEWMTTLGDDDKPVHITPCPPPHLLRADLMQQSLLVGCGVTCDAVSATPHVL